jgi:hypothetical protein
MTTLTKIIQHFERDTIPEHDLASRLRQELRHSGVTIPPHAQIAIAVGSRGISNLPLLVRTTVQWVKKMGGTPFIVPAMGSHGGGTAEGQQQVLESYGVTEKTIGAPIRSSMDVVELPSEHITNKIFMDKIAYEADGTIVINRVKVHTAFHGPVESGLMKMCVIGLGKHQGAREIHQYGAQGLRERISPTARQILKHGNILLGIAVAENAYEETALLQAIRPEQFEMEEITLLRWARAHMPKLPIEQIDVLMIEEFGKHISGTGMDVNIIGRLKISTEPEPESPKITSIVLLDLPNRSHGNANGMGLADIITRRFFENIDFQATYKNILTTGFLERGKMPVVAETEQQALEYALKPCGLLSAADAKIIKIQNTLILNELWVSKPILREIREKDSIEVTDEIQEIPTEGATKNNLTEMAFL